MRSSAMEDLSRITFQNDTLSQCERCLGPHVSVLKEGAYVCRQMPCCPSYIKALASEEECMAEPLACLLLHTQCRDMHRACRIPRSRDSLVMACLPCDCLKVRVTGQK